MNRVAAKIAEEVRMLLQHHDVDAGARQQKSQHHSRRAAAGDAALRGMLELAIPFDLGGRHSIAGRDYCSMAGQGRRHASQYHASLIPVRP